jgi:peptidoglycan/LPS O-acetylase OafA/YrhL
MRDQPLAPAPVEHTGLDAREVAKAPWRNRSIPAKARQTYLPALTGLRFLLALWVILHHLTGRGQPLEPMARSLPAALYALLRGGYLAVTTFFVLSGFVLSRSYSRAKWTRRHLARYAVGRIARVYPVYLVSLLIVAPFIAADRVPGKASLLAAYALLLQAWLGRIPVSWNTPAWSLSCEMFFYLLFPLLAMRFARPGWRNTLTAAFSAAFLTRALWAIGVSDEVKPLIHFSDFLMGAAASGAFELLLERERRPSGAWLYGPAMAAAAMLIAWPGLLPASVDLNSALRPLTQPLDHLSSIWADAIIPLVPQ